MGDAKNVHADYVFRSKYKLKNGDEKIIYKCNRSHYRGYCDSNSVVKFVFNFIFLGFVSTCKKRNMKAGGTIDIHGMCPSRITVNISSNGMCSNNSLSFLKIF